MLVGFVHGDKVGGKGILLPELQFGEGVARAMKLNYN